MTSLHLFLGIIFVCGASITAAEWIECGPPENFEVLLENNKKIYVYDADIKVEFDRNELAVYRYPELDAVNILINNTVVAFSAHIVPDHEQIEHNELKTSGVFNSKIVGKAVLSKVNSNDILTDCDLHMLRISNEEEFNVAKEVQVEILQRAATCVKASICQKLGAVTMEDVRRGSNQPINFGQLPVLALKLSDNPSLQSSISSNNTKLITTANYLKTLITDHDNLNTLDDYELQSTLNKAVDAAIAELVDKIVAHNLTKINIPNLDQEFSTGSGWFKTTGEFRGFNGTFADLSTLRRTENISIWKEDVNFVTSCGIGLTRAIMEYENYKLRYGIIKINGKLLASVDDLALTATVKVKYDQKPCRVILQELRVSELDNVEIKITGLKPLNTVMSKLSTWLTQKWKANIIATTEKNLKDTITNYLDKFNCEMFRP